MMGNLRRAISPSRRSRFVRDIPDHELTIDQGFIRDIVGRNWDRVHPILGCT
ncbi:MAG: hypothetical protein NVSMB16_09670 [Acidimicrobiales bacterium]